MRRERSAVFGSSDHAVHNIVTHMDSRRRLNALLLILTLLGLALSGRRRGRGNGRSDAEVNLIGGWDEFGAVPVEGGTGIYIYEWPSLTTFVPPTAHEVKRGAPFFPFSSSTSKLV